MRWIRRLLAVEVAVCLPIWACAGTTSYESSADSGSPDGSSGAGGISGEASADHAVPSDSSESASGSCAEVGTGPGIESCCEGQRCHGSCQEPTPYYPACRCDGAVCPPGAACCWIANPDTGDPFGPFCVAPEDCIAPQ